MGALQFMIELILYTRNDCELCREMEEVIAAELPNFDARIQRVEIDGDAGLEARFGTGCSSLRSPARQCFLPLRPHCRSSEFPLRVHRP